MAENSNDEQYTSFLGTGWSFPPEFAYDSGEALMRSDEDDIAESLRILLGTAIGERFLNPKYGLDLHDMLFEPMSTTMTTLLKNRIETAILIYESRIELLSVALDMSAQNEGRVSLEIDYKVRATDSRYNLVYPFYTVGGSEVKATKSSA